MGNLLGKGIITEQECGSAFLYIMSDSSLFLPTEYKVLQGQTDSCFLKCMKMLYNGKVMLCYMPGQLVPFESIIGRMNSRDFIKVVAGYISAILKVKSNGFLSYKNIETDFSKIYVDQGSGDVYLVYVPCAQHNFEDYYSFEDTVRNSLIGIIDMYGSFGSEEVLRLRENLETQGMGFETICSNLGCSAPEKEKSVPNDVEQPRKERVPRMSITPINAPVSETINITKKEFVIGKNPNIVDGVISYNKAVSRKHCMVVFNDGVYSMVDLESSNGTYVNGVRLVPNTLNPVKNGDLLRLADSDFRIEVV